MKNITPFMMNLHKELREKREIADVTANQYIRTLYSLNSELPFKNLAWLKNTPSVELRLQNYAESTQKTMLSTIVSTLSLVKSSSYKKIFAYWYNRMMERVEEDKTKDSSVKTPKQEKNWLSWDVILSHEKRLEEEVQAIKSFTPADWPTILAFMVLSLYTKFSPRRNQDYQFMKVVKSAKQVTTNFNYFVMDTSQFVFNKYKTADSHGEQTFDVPPELLHAIMLYLKFHPAKSPKGFQFLVLADGSPLPSVNSITRILNRIFGRNVGTTMLRHIYLSNKYNVTEMNEDAEKMGHTSGMQHEYMKVNIPEA
jgi:hypothetical protein